MGSAAVARLLPLILLFLTNRAGANGGTLISWSQYWQRAFSIHLMNQGIMIHMVSQIIIPSVK